MQRPAEFTVMRRLATAGRARQRGQAALMSYLFAAVLVVAMLSLFRTGRLTSDKMELQNAADALAFSVSTVEARDLNFAAYTNRAIVANEVAIGQAVGMASWAAHWTSIGNFMREYDLLAIGPSTLGVSTPIINSLANVFTVPGKIFEQLMQGYANAMTAVNHNVNKAYGISQQIYHLVSVVNTLGLLEESIEKNAPDNAHMSAYGVLMLLAHLSTYGGLPVPVTEKFTTSYNPKAPATPIDEWKVDTTGETDAGGFGRLAALIHNSGDPFTKGSHNPPVHDDPDLSGRGWVINFFKVMKDAGLLPAPERITFNAGPFSGYGEFGVYDEGNRDDNRDGVPDGDGWLGFAVGTSIDFGIIGASIDFYIKLRMQMLREGGSELRMTVPLAGTNKDKAAGELFSWSSADSTNFDLGFKGGLGFEAWLKLPWPVGKIDLIDLDFDLAVANERLVIAFNLGGGGDAGSCAEIEDEDDREECINTEASEGVEIYNGPFPTSAPLGAAFAYTGKKTGPKKNVLTSAPKHMATQLDFPGAPSGPIPGEAYGNAAERLIAWYYPTGSFATGIYFQPTDPRYIKSHVGKSYGGLPRYIDTTNAEPLFKSGGPMFVASLSLDQGDFIDENYTNSGDEPAGRFEMNEAFGWDSMSAVSKSEVHFNRPLDLGYFARGDGYVEHGSTFNPYWQARLIETSHADRVMALLLTHGEVAQGVSFGAEIDSLVAWISGALGL